MLLNINATRAFILCFFTILNQKEFRTATVAMFTRELSRRCVAVPAGCLSVFFAYIKKLLGRTDMIIDRLSAYVQLDISPETIEQDLPFAINDRQFN